MRTNEIMSNITINTPDGQTVTIPTTITGTFTMENGTSVTIANGAAKATGGKRRGRPPGSKNKPKEPAADSPAVIVNDQVVTGTEADPNVAAKAVSKRRTAAPKGKRTTRKTKAAAAS